MKERRDLHEVRTRTSNDEEFRGADVSHRREGRAVSMWATMLARAGGRSPTAGGRLSRRPTRILEATSEADRTMASLPISSSWRSTAPVFPRKMLYTGTPRAAASRFMVPPPLTTRSEYQIRFESIHRPRGDDRAPIGEPPGERGPEGVALGSIAGQEHDPNARVGEQVVHDLDEQDVALGIAVVGFVRRGADGREQVGGIDSKLLGEAGIRPEIRRVNVLLEPGIGQQRAARGMRIAVVEDRLGNDFPTGIAPGRSLGVLVVADEHGWNPEQIGEGDWDLAPWESAKSGRWRRAKGSNWADRQSIPRIFMTRCLP